MLIGLLLIALLILANGFFVASEFALVSVRKTRIEQLVAEGHSTARAVKYAMEHLQTYIAATQVGITMASLGLGALGEPILATILIPPLELVFPANWVESFVSLHGIAIAFAFLIVTILEIVLGEMVPKLIARQRSERSVLFIIRPLNFFAFIFTPLIWVINLLGNAVLRLIRMPPGNEQTSVHSVEELEMLVVSSREAGVLEAEEEAILRRVFDLGDLTARQIMLPRTEVVGIPVDGTLREVIEIMERTKHSRFPVYEGDLDHILGVVHVKDFFLALSRDMEVDPEHTFTDWSGTFKVREFMRPVTLEPETLSANELLARMLHNGVHMSVVIDEYGGTAGIVTLEDVVEEIVGDVRDEFEESVETPDIVFTPEGTRINGLTPITEVNERLGFRIESESDTVGGYVFETLGRKPELGDEVAVDGHVMRVEELDGLRIAEVKILPHNKQTPATPVASEEQ